MFSLVIVSKFEPSSVFDALFPYLLPSRPFVIFSHYLQPLVELCSRLYREGTAVNLDLNETWMREYQVLPDRTHPMMRMDNESGFILSGIKVVNLDSTSLEEQDEPEVKKRKT